MKTFLLSLPVLALVALGDDSCAFRCEEDNPWVCPCTTNEDHPCADWDMVAPPSLYGGCLPMLTSYCCYEDAEDPACDRFKDSFKCNYCSDDVQGWFENFGGCLSQLNTPGHTCDKDYNDYDPVNIAKGTVLKYICPASCNFCEGGVPGEGGGDEGDDAFHDRSACRENGIFDDDCCAYEGTMACNQGELVVSKETCCPDCPAEIRDKLVKYKCMQTVDLAPAEPTPKPTHEPLIGDHVHTILSWTRSVDGCGDDDVSIPTAGISRVIWAMGNKGVTPRSHKSISYHEDRGAASIALRTKKVRAERPADARYFDFTMNDFYVHHSNGYHSGDRRTYYICAAFELPAWTQDGKKRHIIEVEPLIQSGNEKKVHHTIAYTCNGLKPEQVGLQLNCLDYFNMPREVSSCDGKAPLFATYAIGGTTTYYPPEAGYPIGTNHVQRVIFNMHYDNYDFKAFNDNSGFRFWVTEALRPNDLGVFFSGLVDGIYIPAGVEGNIHRTRCSGSGEHACLGEKYMKGDGITITHTFLHGHTKTVRVKAEMVDEDDNVVKVIADESQYDFDLQNTYELEEHVTVPRGKSIDVTCTYNTAGETEPTYGGEATSEEMCLGYFYHYPAMDLSWCQHADLAEGTAAERIGQQYRYGAGAVRYNTGETVNFCYDSRTSLATMNGHFSMGRNEMAEKRCDPKIGDEEASSHDFASVSEADAFLASYANSYILNGNKLKLYWTYNDMDQTIDFAMDAVTDGWVGFGISPNGGMAGSDMVIGWVDSRKGKTVMGDFFAGGKYIPSRDDVQSLTMMKGSLVEKTHVEEDSLLRDNLCQFYYHGDPKDCETLRDMIRSDLTTALPVLTLGDPADQPMMFIHGWPDNAAEFAHQFEYFCGPKAEGKKYYCIAPSLFNFHPQVATRPDDDLFIDRQVDAFHQLVVDLKLENMILVGHDWGSWMSYAYAYRYPNDMVAVVTMDVGMTKGPAQYPADISTLPEYQQANIMAYRDADPEEFYKQNVQANIGPIIPCQNCDSDQVRSVWPYLVFVYEGEGDYSQRLAKDVDPKDWVFNWIPEFPEHLPFLYMHAKCNYGSGCKSCPVEECQPRADSFEDEFFLNFIRTRGETSHVVEIESDHWIPSRGADEANVQITLWLEKLKQVAEPELDYTIPCKQLKDKETCDARVNCKSKANKKGKLKKCNQIQCKKLKKEADCKAAAAVCKSITSKGKFKRCK